jgi:hypothetical protein
MSTDTQRRVLFLVTTPVSESLDWVLYKIDSATRESPLPTQEVDWDDTSDPITSIPTIKPTLSFTRHLALGAMDKEDWDDTSLTNLQRFSKAYFWEHRGSSNEPRQGNGWGRKKSAVSRRSSSLDGQRNLTRPSPKNVRLQPVYRIYRRLLDANLRSQIVRSSSKGGRTCLYGGIASRSRLDWHFWSSSSRHSETSSRA